MIVKLATEDGIDDIMKIFRKYPKIFPHIRKDKILSLIEKCCVLYKDGVVITFGKYQKKVTLGNVIISRGSWILHQIVNTEPQNGKSKEILNEFLNYIDGNCYLTVRADNTTARKFYEKNGFIEVGNISWKNGEIPGKVYKKEYCRVA